MKKLKVHELITALLLIIVLFISVGLSMVSHKTDAVKYELDSLNTSLDSKFMQIWKQKKHSEDFSLRNLFMDYSVCHYLKR